MRGLQGIGWLLVGAVLGLVVPATGLHRRVPDLLGAVLALPWAGILVGVLLFGSCAGLYFRSHWAATARAHGESVRRAAEAAERLQRLGEDIDRSAFLIGDNLREVDSTTGAHRDLYLDGARAHAEKLSRAAERCRGLASRLGPGVPAEGASRAADVDTDATLPS